MNIELRGGRTVVVFPGFNSGFVREGNLQYTLLLKLELSRAHIPRAASDSALTATVCIMSVDDLYLHTLGSCVHEQKAHGFW